MSSIYNLIQKFRQWLPKKNKYALTIKDDGIPYLDFVKSIVQTNKVGNDYVAQSFYETWVGREQYRAVGRFLAHLPLYLATPVGSQPVRPRILDAGCGPGNYVKAFDNLGLETVGIDISKEMLTIDSQVTSRSSALCGAHSLGPSPVLLEMDAFSPEFPDDFFDGIWYSASRTKSVLEGFYKLLKPGGWLFVNFKLEDHSLISLDDRFFEYYRDHTIPQACLESVGFRIDESCLRFNRRNMYNDPKTIRWVNFFCQKPD